MVQAPKKNENQETYIKKVVNDPRLAAFSRSERRRLAMDRWGATPLSQVGKKR